MDLMAIVSVLIGVLLALIIDAYTGISRMLSTATAAA